MSAAKTHSNYQVITKNKLANTIRQASKNFAASALLMGAACASWADAADVHEFSIAPQPLAEALAQFSTQSGLQLLVNGDAVRQLRAPELKGELRNDVALDRLLSQSGLVYEFREDDTVVIKTEGKEKIDATKLEVDEEVVVTGSRLSRNPSELAGQFIGFSSEDIKASGETSLERFLRRLPQNFQGTTEFSGNRLNGATNLTGASTINLRGLGDNATLILVDGHRRGSNGLFGGVTDISGIPLSQVERIEILLDGASAIYGSDAVGGVINIITKKDYRGVVAGLEYTEPSAGVFDEYRFNLNGGFGWDSGNLRASYEYADHSGLVAQDSGLALISQPDTINLFNLPQPGFQGQVVSPTPLFYTNGSTNITVAAFDALSAAEQGAFSAINEATLPVGFNANSSVVDITEFMLTDNSVSGTGDADTGELLLPERTSHTFNFVVNQELGSVNLGTSLTYSTREVRSGGRLPSISDQIGANNPFNPFGVRLGYVALLPSLNGSFRDADEDQLDFTFDLDGNFSESWRWYVGGSYSRSETDGVRGERLDSVTLGSQLDDQSIFLPAGSPPPADNCTLVSSAFGFDRFSCSPDNPANPFGDLSQFILPEQLSDTRNSLSVIGGYVSGSLFSLPAGDATLAAGFEWQQRKINSASEFAVGVLDTSSVGNNPFAASIGRDSVAGYIEGMIPLVGENNSLPMIDSFDVTFSGRYDSYDAPSASRTLDVPLPDPSDPIAVAEFEAFNTPVEIGGDSTWGAGFVWGVNDSLRFKANIQTAFVAPQLNQLFRSTDPRFNRGFTFLFIENEEGNLAFTPIGQVLGGGNPSLKPETSQSKTYTVEFTPEFIPGLSVSIAHSETDYQNRITVLSSNGSIVSLDNLPSDIVVLDNGDLLLDTRFVNAASLSRSGIDYRVSYDWGSDFGEFGLDLSVSRINSHTFQADVIDTPENVVEDSTDPRFFPVPRYSGDLQFTWQYQQLTASLSANRRSDTSRTSLASGGEVNFITTNSSPDTVNLTLSYNFGQDSSIGWLANTVATLGVENLTNDFSEDTLFDADTGETEVFVANQFTSLGRGRVFNLRLQKEF